MAMFGRERIPGGCRAVVCSPPAEEPPAKKGPAVRTAWSCRAVEGLAEEAICPVGYSQAEPFSNDPVATATAIVTWTSACAAQSWAKETLVQVDSRATRS